MSAGADTHALALADDERATLLHLIAAQVADRIAPQLQPTDPDELLTTAQVAAITGTDESLWRRYTQRGRIPVVMLGRYVRIRRRDLTVWLEDNTVPALAGPAGSRGTR